MPVAANVGDKCIIHCSVPNIAKGAKKTFIGGRLAARIGDPVTPHEQPTGDTCTTHTATIAKGSLKVFIEGQGAARLGDPLTACTAISGPGTPKVFIGG